MSVCTGSLIQWNTIEQCEAACADFPGQSTIFNPLAIDSTTNSLPCRKYHATAASTTGNPTLHCPHAGVLGGGQCGTECDGYCNLVVGSCTGWTTSACLTFCGNLTSSLTTSTSDILAGKVAKGSVGCGTYWGVKATTDNTVCAKAMAATECGSGALITKASWAIIALILLALGFSS